MVEPALGNTFERMYIPGVNDETLNDIYGYDDEDQWEEEEIAWSEYWDRRYDEMVDRRLEEAYERDY